TIILYEDQGGISFRDVDFKDVKTIGLVVGSEGGFDPEETQSAVESGAVRVWLGKRILRCETAPITAISILMFLTNNM
nr:RsmE family RNA methyltransferase [Ruminococcus sp.]